MNWKAFWIAFAVWGVITLTLQAIGAPSGTVWVLVVAYVLYLYKDEILKKLRRVR